MIEYLLKQPMFRRYFPPAAGIIFAALFVSLGTWQLDRAAEKKALLSKFEVEGRFNQVSDFSSLDEFERIQLEGEFLPERQVLIDNIVLDGRPGYYVITPFKPNSADPIMLINRGWTPKSMNAGDLPDLTIGQSGYQSVRGLVGRLPRVAIRPGEAFADVGSWPRIAVYPRLDEIAAALDRPVLPVVLLLAADNEHGFVRRWQPNVSGPSTHYGYAVQWFAMAATAIALMIWHLRKRLRHD